MPHAIVQNPGETERALRQALQDVRQSVQQAQQEAARVGAEAGQARLDPNLAVDVLRGEMTATRELVAQLSTQLGNDGLSNAQVDAINRQLDAATSRLDQLQTQLDARLAQGAAGTTAPSRPADDLEREAMKLGRDATQWFFITVAVVAIGIPLARAFGRWLDRRGNPPRSSTDESARLERMEQAIEAVAIEVERISEGQRYTNKLMQDVRGLPAPDPAASWAPAQARQAVPVRVDESR